MKTLDPIAFLGTRKSVGRWGDGEWLSVFGRKGVNADKCPYRSATNALIACLKAKDHAVLSLQPLARRTMWPEIRRWLEQNARHRLEQSWYDAHYMVDLVKKNVMHEFVRELGRYKTLLIGPAYLEKLGITDEFYEIPERDAVAHVPTPPPVGSADVVLASAGFLGTVMAHWYADEDVTYMDVGSAFDPYVGRKSRNTWKRLVNEGGLRPLR